MTLELEEEIQQAVKHYKTFEEICPEWSVLLQNPQALSMDKANTLRGDAQHCVVGEAYAHTCWWRQPNVCKVCEAYSGLFGIAGSQCYLNSLHFSSRVSEDCRKAGILLPADLSWTFHGLSTAFGQHWNEAHV